MEPEHVQLRNGARTDRRNLIADLHVFPIAGMFAAEFLRCPELLDQLPFLRCGDMGGRRAGGPLRVDVIVRKGAPFRGPVRIAKESILPRGMITADQVPVLVVLKSGAAEGKDAQFGPFLRCNILQLLFRLQRGNCVSGTDWLKIFHFAAAVAEIMLIAKFVGKAWIKRLMKRKEGERDHAVPEGM